MKVTFRIPSKAITYGYIETETELPDGTDPAMLGALYANTVHAFLVAEHAAAQAALIPATTAPPEPEHEDVVAILAAQLPATVIEENVHPEESDPDEQPKPWEGEVKAPAKPWEKKAAPKVAAIDW